jgi:hypothetical protein
MPASSGLPDPPDRAVFRPRLIERCGISRMGVEAEALVTIYAVDFAWHFMPVGPCAQRVTKLEKTLRKTLPKPPLHWYIPPAPHG